MSQLLCGIRGMAVYIIVIFGFAAHAVAENSHNKDDAVFCASLGFARGSNEHTQCVVNLSSASGARPLEAPQVGSVPPEVKAKVQLARPKTSAARSGQSSSGSNGNPIAPDALSLAKAAFISGDEPEAFRLTISAARRGDPRAQVVVARYYREGIGTEVDIQKSIYWLNEAVKKGDPAGFYNLSLAYIYGVGVTKDLQKGFDYAQSADRLGYSGASKLLDFIKNSVGENNFTCMTYGFRQSTPDFGRCLLQLDQAQQQAALVRRQTEIAQGQLELERQRLEQQRLAAAEAQRLAEVERLAAERKRKSDALKAMSEDFLCPKKTPGLFAEPVAGCGRNKNEPVPANVQVIIQN